MLNTLVWQTHGNCPTCCVYTKLILDLSCWLAMLPQDLSEERNIASIATSHVAQVGNFRGFFPVRFCR